MRMFLQLIYWECELSVIFYICVKYFSIHVPSFDKISWSVILK